MIKEEDKLEAALRYLSDPELKDKRSASVAKNLIEECIRANIRCKRNKFDIFDWVSGDRSRPVMCCVWHDHSDRVAVASDGRCLVASKKDYIESLPKNDRTTICGHVASALNKKGELLEIGRFPDYKSIIRTDSLAIVPMLVSRDELQDCTVRLREYNMRHKLGINESKPLIRIGDGAYVELRSAERILSLPGMKLFYHVDKSSEDKADRSTIYYADDNILALFFNSVRSFREDSLVPYCKNVYVPYI